MTFQKENVTEELIKNWPEQKSIKCPGLAKAKDSSWSDQFQQEL